MSRPIDPHEPGYNPFMLDRSKLLQAASALSKSAPPAEASAPQPGEAHFSISTRQIISLITRFRLDSMRFEDLIDLPLSQLNEQEKDFVNYLRRNPDMFQLISGLDQNAGTLSAEDVKKAASLSGDALVLSDKDLEYLKSQQPQPQNPNTPPRFGLNAPDAKNAAPRLQTQDLINVLQRLNPAGGGLPFNDLQAIQAGQSGLRGQNLAALNFLQSPTVSKVLERLTLPYGGMISPEVLRVLTSLLWNPAIFGAAPIIFFKTGPLHQDEDVDPLEAAHTVDIIGDHNPNLKSQNFKPTLRLEAHVVSAICHRLSQNGHVTLEQLRRYKPQNMEEEKALNLLRQTHIFRALAQLDHHHETLGDEDIRLALAEGALVLSDPYIVLVILP